MNSRENSPNRLHTACERFYFAENASRQALSKSKNYKLNNSTFAP
jgi:hypothetical protein